MDKLEDYLKSHPDHCLVNYRYRVKYVRGLEETAMALKWVQNEHHPKGKWRVSRLGDGQLCCYFGESFDDALQKLQTDLGLAKLSCNYHD